jgi:transcriptional regulator with XRE-family HTH domain
MTITGQQVKAARRLLGWSQAELATKAGMTLIAIQVLELYQRR